MTLDFLPRRDDLDIKAQAKPARGTARAERHERSASREHDERINKAIVRKQDGTCRWPGCRCQKGPRKLPLEVAHVVAKSLGGSSAPENLILVCDEVHRGAVSLHSQDRKIEPLTNKGTRGPCAFYQRDEFGVMQHVASERSIGVSEPRRR